MLEKVRSYWSEHRWRLIPWIVLTVGAINVIFIGGKRRTFAVFISALHSDFNGTSRAELNWIADSYSGLAFLLMPAVTNALIDLDRAYRSGMALAAVLVFVSSLSSSLVSTPGALFFTHTVLHGIGSALIMSSTALIVGEYFDKKHRFHVLATTLVTGGPYGALIFGPIYGNLVADVGWRNALRIIGFTFFCEVMLGAAVYYPMNYDYDPIQSGGGGENSGQLVDTSHPQDPTKPLPSAEQVAGTGGYLSEEDIRHPKKITTLKKRKLWTVIPREHLVKNPQIYLWIVERLLHNIILYSLMMNLVDLMTDANALPIEKAATINLLFGAGESVTFTFGVVFGDRLKGKFTLCYAVASGVATFFLFMASTSLNHVDALLMITFFLGAAVGTGNTCVYATAEEVMIIHGSVGFPATKMIAGIGMFIAPIFSGYLIDKVGFGGFFVCQGILMGMRFVLLLLIMLALVHRKRMAAKEESDKLVDELCAEQQRRDLNKMGEMGEWKPPRPSSPPPLIQLNRGAP